MKLIQLILIFNLFLFLTSCGSSSNTTAGGSAMSSPTVYAGVFIDSIVEGLSYRTTSQSGTTNASGEFNYLANEQVTFSIGDIEFPAVSAQEVITPLEIFGVTDFQDISVINLARLLQTLDSDGDSSNGISITAMAHSSATGLTVDFGAADFEQQVAMLVANAGSINVALIDGNSAISHLQQTINDLPADTQCGSSHSKVGYVGEFSTRFHDVTGSAVIIDDCTIQVTAFNYDGRGPAVYFYAGIDHDYNAEQAFQMSDLLNGPEYVDEMVEIKLPIGKTLDDFNTMSVWCADFLVSFGQLEFTSP